jgi:hypothetical protein
LLATGPATTFVGVGRFVTRPGGGGATTGDAGTVGRGDKATGFSGDPTGGLAEVVLPFRDQTVGTEEDAGTPGRRDAGTGFSADRLGRSPVDRATRPLVATGVPPNSPAGVATGADARPVEAALFPLAKVAGPGGLAINLVATIGEVVPSQVADPAPPSVLAATAPLVSLCIRFRKYLAASSGWRSCPPGASSILTFL